MRKALSAQCRHVNAQGVDALWKTCFGKRGAGLSDQMQVCLQASMQVSSDQMQVSMQACMQVSMCVSMQASSDEMQVTKGKVRDGSSCAATQCKGQEGCKRNTQGKRSAIEKAVQRQGRARVCGPQPAGSTAWPGYSAWQGIGGPRRGLGEARKCLNVAARCLGNGPCTAVRQRSAIQWTGPCYFCYH